LVVGGLIYISAGLHVVVEKKKLPAEKQELISLS
jgi:hypothetical protein